MLCLCFYVFFNGPGDSKHLGSAGRQEADKYIAPGGKFFMFFMCLILHMNRVTWRSVYFRSVLLFWWELLFSPKGGLAVSKRGPAPFFLKKGASAPFLREIGVPAKK